MNCRDMDAIDNQPHILKCSVLLEKLSPEEHQAADQVAYNHIFGTLDQQRNMVLVLSRMLDIREELIEDQ